MLCGRSAEIQQIDRLMADAHHGRSGVLVLRGEAGIGKTSLLDYARHAADGMRVISVRGTEPERNLTFAGLAQLVYPAQHAIDGLIPAQAQALRGAVALGPPEPTDRFAVYIATLNLLSGLADGKPVLVVIDDAHTLDSPSVEALEFVGRRLMAEGVVLLAASRTGVPYGSRPEFGTSLPARDIAGLDESAARELIAAHSGVRPAKGVLRRMLRGTAGNPMALLELLDMTTEAQLTGRQSLPERAPAVVTAGRLFADRVRNLGGEAQLGLLLLSSGASTRLTVALDAATILGVPLTSWTELEAAQLVIFDNGSFRFTHPLVATAALSVALPTQRRAVHRALAAVLTGTAQAEQRAWHLAEATIGTDERVAAALEDMASAARARSGYAAAVTALERSAALSEDDASRARRLFAAASDAQLAGQSGRARDMLLAADGLTDDVDLRIDVAVARSRIEAFSGHPKVAHTILQQAAQLLPATNPRRRAQLLADSAMAAFLAGDPAAALASAAEAEALLTEPSTDLALITKLIRGTMMMHLGRHRDGALLLDGCAAIARRQGSGGATVEYILLASAAMVWTGQHHAAKEALTPVLAQLRAAGAVGLLPLGLYVLGMAEARIGRTEQAIAVASESMDLADLGGDILWRYLATSLLAYVEAIRGDVDQCREHGRAALALMPADGDRPRDAAEALGLLELSLGRYDDAIEWYRQGAQSTPALPAASLVEGNRDVMEAYVRSGRGLTAHMTTVLAELTADARFPLDAAVAWRVTGLAASEAEYAGCFSNALKFHDDIACPLEAGRTHLAYGERLRRSGHRVQARAQLRPALEIFEQLHALVWAERARTELTATGETLRKPATYSIANELTPQELQVARAVVRGATNREAAATLFLSTKTVEFHLSNVFRKLGVRTRTELAHRFPDLIGASGPG